MASLEQSNLVFMILPFSLSDPLSNLSSLKKKHQQPKEVPSTDAISPWSTSNRVYINPAHCRPSTLSNQFVFLGDFVSLQSHTQDDKGRMNNLVAGYVFADTQLNPFEIRVPTSLLKSLQLHIGDQIQLTPICSPIPLARKVHLSWMNEHLQPSYEFVAVVHSLLMDLELISIHQNILWSYLDTRLQSSIIKILPESNTLSDSCMNNPSFYRITQQTRIQFIQSDIPTSLPTPTLPAFLGFDDVLQDVHKSMELALSDVSRTNVSCVRGILIWGPTGTGKTMFIRHLLQRYYSCFDFDIVWVDASDTKEKIDKMIAAPCSTLILNDLEMFDSSLFFHLGKVMDRCCFTLATCKQLNNVPEVLLKPGRLDRDIEFNMLTIHQRKAILEHFVDEPFSTSFLEKLNGYSPADLVRLVQVARECNKDDLGRSLENAQKIVKPTIFESAVQIPIVKWSDIGGNEHIKDILREVVEWPTSRGDEFKRFGITPPKGILLYGPPGCSKTLFAKALANEANKNFIAVKGPELFSKWVGDSEKAIKQVFQKARAMAPSILFFDEIDSIATKRASDSNSLSVLDRVIAQLLNELDGIEPLLHVTVVAATNRPDLLDPALMRPGRMDLKIYVGPPDQASIKAILTLHLKKIQREEINLDYFASKLQGCSGAEIVQFCQDAGMNALERDIINPRAIFQDFEDSLKQVTRRITPAILQFYDKYQENHGYV